jgi:hypothetical protein
VEQLGIPAAEMEELRRDITAQLSVVVVMDPATMPPHRLETLSSFRTLAPDENGGGVVPTTQTDLRVHEWTYEN